MKILLALMLIAPSAFAASSVNNYDCVGQQLDKNGNKIGYGNTFVVVLNNGTARLVDRDNGQVIELLSEGSDRFGSSQIYRTESTRVGVGLAIHNSNIDARLGSQVNLYIFSIANDRAGASNTLDCRVVSASRL